MNKLKSEIKHFTTQEHIWWGAKTAAGQKRYDNKFSLFIALCKPSYSNRILEIGCGDGEFTKRLATLSSQIDAVDLTPAVIERGKKYFKKKKNVHFREENVENLSFKNRSFDIVCGVSILHHTNLLQTLKEAFRVLRPGGQIFFTEPNLINPIMLIISNSPVLRKIFEFSPHETALVRLKVKEALRKAKFTKIEVWNYDFLHPSTPIWAIGIVEKISNILEKTPVVKELSGSLLIWAKK